MADKKTRRLSPKVLQEDLDALAALDAMSDYAPSNAAYSKANGQTIKAAAQAKQAKEVQDAAQAAASRDAAVAGEWDIHDFVQGAANQVRAQYGEDSDEYAALGFKKKSEYKRPVRKPKNP